MNIIKNINNQNKLKAVDFFCSGGGMSSGMLNAGIKILAGIDYDNTCKDTYQANINGAKFIHADVFEYKEEALQNELNLKKNDDDLILIGCSPCQFWSIINTDKTKSTKSKSLLIEFKRFVEYFNHALGHQVGFRYHDPGSCLSPNCTDVLQEGMVLTIEPGIYGVELNGGVRIEDNFLITASGCQLLSNYPRSLRGD